ncbi:MAG: hypothetical protein AAFY20_10605, partial [Cyanobacteria bacterium J06639_14]
MKSSKQSKPSDLKAHALVVAVLAMFGMGLIVIKPNFTRFLIGAVACVAADCHRLKHKLGYGDVFGAVREAVDLGGESLNQEFAPLTEALHQKKIRIQTQAFSQLPFAEQVAKRMEQANTLRTNGLELFASAKSGLLLGDTGDGKTRLLNWLIAHFMHTHPEHQLLIGDIDYGSAHAGSEPNTWMKLPVGSVVLIEPEDIYQAIIDVADDVESRATATRRAMAEGRPAPSFKPKLLVIDEWITFYADHSEKQQAALVEALNKIVVRGVKQQIYCFMACHDASVGSIGISQAKMARWNVLALYKWVCQAKSTDVSNLPRGFDEVAEKVKIMPRQVGEAFTAMTYVDSKWQIAGIPFIDPDSQIE